MFTLERNYNPDFDTRDQTWFLVAQADTADELRDQLPAVEWQAGRYRIVRSEVVADVRVEDPTEPPDVDALVRISD